MKKLLRNLVVRTSGTPLVHVYRAIYRAIMAIAVAMFRRHRSVVAVYVWRGCARDDFLPGISDIDLLVVVEDGSDEVAAIREDFRRMKALSAGIIDYYPKLVTERATLERRWKTVPIWRYRYMEGRLDSRLLHGEDVLAALPDLGIVDRRSAVWSEMNRWWLTFVERIRAQGDGDVLADNVTCYKAFSELTGLERALADGTVAGARAESIRELNDPLAARIKLLEAQGFLVRDAGVVDAVVPFVVQLFTRVWDRFEDHPFLEVLPVSAQRCDCPAEEVEIRAPAAAMISALREYAAATAGCHGISVVKSAFWDLDDLLAVITLDPACLADGTRLAALATLHGRLQPSCTQRVLLFVRVGSLAFPLTPSFPEDLHRGVLAPATAPDVFLQLGDAQVPWTSHARWYLCQWETNERWPRPCERKREQLRAITRSAEEGHVVYPLTAAALGRAVQGR